MRFRMLTEWDWARMASGMAGFGYGVLAFVATFVGQSLGVEFTGKYLMHVSRAARTEPWIFLSLVFVATVVGIAVAGLVYRGLQSLKTPLIHHLAAGPGLAVAVCVSAWGVGFTAAWGLSRIIPVGEVTRGRWWLSMYLLSLYGAPVLGGSAGLVCWVVGVVRGFESLKNKLMP